MDRRQRKTRKAIFDAFTELLSKKNFAHITVAEIIEKADVGRATFYDHFETKDYLLKELCQELFCHVFDSVKNESEHKHIFSCNAPDSFILHLIQHLQRNDNGILELMSCRNNELFLSYFKSSLKELIVSQISVFCRENTGVLPESLFVNHISSAFIELIRWWLDNGRKETADELSEYFSHLV